MQGRTYSPVHVRGGGYWEENGFQCQAEGVERKKVIALAQAREIDAVLVMELTR